MKKISDMASSLNDWLNETSPAMRAAVAFGGMIVVSLLATIVFDILKHLIALAL